MQPKMLVATLAVRVACWLVGSLVSTRTPRSTAFHPVIPQCVLVHGVIPAQQQVLAPC